MTCRILLAILLLLRLLPSAFGSSTTNAPPELAKLKTSYDAAVAKQEQELEKRLSSLCSGYEEALEKLEAEYKEAGKLRPLIAVRKEEERFGASRTISRNDLVSEAAELRHLQINFGNSQAQCKRQYQKQHVSLTMRYVQMLSALQEQLTREDRIEDALAVEAEIKRVRSEHGLKPTEDQALSVSRSRAGVGYAAWTPDYMLEFNGRSTVVEIPDCEDLSGRPGKSITVEAWVKPYAVDPKSRPSTVIGKVQDREWKDYVIYYAPRDSRINLRIDNNDDNWSVKGPVIPVGKLSHIAFVFNNEKNSARIMLNGRTVVEKRQTKDCPDTSASLTIGESAGVFFHGLIDEVRVSNIARYQSEFVPERRHQSDDNTVLLLHFDEGGGRRATDSSGREHHGTVSGGKWLRFDTPTASAGGIPSDGETEPAPPAASLRLSANWELAGLKGGSLILTELGGMLRAHASANVDLRAHPNLVLYRNVSYLMPLKQAVDSLGLKHIASRNIVTTAGFPRGSFVYHKFDGDFGAGVNKLLLVTDQTDQVVAVQLVVEAPKRRRMKGHSRKRGLYNIIQMRRKGSTHWAVARKAHYRNGVLRLDHEVIDKKGAPREFTRVFLPKPLIGLVLHTIKKNQDL